METQTDILIPHSGFAARRARARRLRLAIAVACSGCLLGVAFACSPANPLHTVSLQSLESAPPAAGLPPRRFVVSDTEALRKLCQPLGHHLALVQIRSHEDWQQLARAVPQIGPCPDLTHGRMVGLVTEAGLPLGGGWPLNWDAVRVVDGAALIEAHFAPGNYLPDGLTCLETAYVENLRSVLVVAVDNAHYYPE